MSRRVKYTNARGDSVVLYATKSSFELNSIEGLGSVEAQVQTQKSPFQNGSTVVSRTLGERDIELGVTIRGDDRIEISNLRRQLARVFDPLAGDGGVLEYTIEEGLTYAIVCEADSSPIYPSGSDRLPTMQKCSISLTAYNPYWTDVSDRYTELVAFTNAFTMPFSFPVTFGEQGASQTIYNTGDASTPFRVELKGSNETPRIENLTTGQKIQLNRSLDATETLYINTEKGKKSAYVIGSDGVKVNVMGYLDPSSEFFELAMGENVISYNAVAASGSSIALIKWKQRYNAI